MLSTIKRWQHISTLNYRTYLSLSSWRIRGRESGGHTHTHTHLLAALARKLNDREKSIHATGRHRRCRLNPKQQSELFCGERQGECMHVNVVNRFMLSNEVKTYGVYCIIEWKKLLRLMDNFVLLVRECAR